MIRSSRIPSSITVGEGFALPNGSRQERRANLFHSKLIGRNHRVHRQLWQRHLGAMSGGILFNGLAEGRNLFRLERKARRHRMSAVAGQQALAGSDRFNQGKSLDAASRPLGGGSVHGKNQARACRTAPQPGADDSNHAGMVALSRKNEDPAAGQRRVGRNLFRNRIGNLLFFRPAGGRSALRAARKARRLLHRLRSAAASPPHRPNRACRRH